MNFHYSRKMTVAMEALGLVEDNATIKKFENCYHKATVTTFTDAKKSFGSKFIDMVLDHSHPTCLSSSSERRATSRPICPSTRSSFPSSRRCVARGRSHQL